MYFSDLTPNYDCGEDDISASAAVVVSPKSILNCTLHLPHGFETKTISSTKKCLPREETNFCALAFPSRIKNLVVEKEHGAGRIYFVANDYIFSRFSVDLNAEFRRAWALPPQQTLDDAETHAKILFVDGKETTAGVLDKIQKSPPAHSVFVVIENRTKVAQKITRDMDIPPDDILFFVVLSRVWYTFSGKNLLNFTDKFTPQQVRVVGFKKFEDTEAIGKTFVTLEDLDYENVLNDRLLLDLVHKCVKSKGCNLVVKLALRKSRLQTVLATMFSIGINHELTAVSSLLILKNYFNVHTIPPPQEPVNVLARFSSDAPKCKEEFEDVGEGYASFRDLATAVCSEKDLITLNEREINTKNAKFLRPRNGNDKTLLLGRKAHLASLNLRHLPYIGNTYATMERLEIFYDGDDQFNQNLINVILSALSAYNYDLFLHVVRWRENLLIACESAAKQLRLLVFVSNKWIEIVEPAKPSAKFESLFDEIVVAYAQYFQKRGITDKCEIIFSLSGVMPANSMRGLEEGGGGESDFDLHDISFVFTLNEYSYMQLQTEYMKYQTIGKKNMHSIKKNYHQVHPRDMTKYDASVYWAPAVSFSPSWTKVAENVDAFILNPFEFRQVAPLNKKTYYRITVAFKPSTCTVNICTDLKESWQRVRNFETAYLPASEATKLFVFGDCTTNCEIMSIEIFCRRQQQIIKM